MAAQKINIPQLLIIQFIFISFPKESNKNIFRFSILQLAYVSLKLIDI